MQQGIFGFNFVKKSDKQELLSPVPPNADDSVSIVGTGNFYTQNIATISTDAFTTETALINKYREISLFPEIDSAIDEVINEAIASDLPYAPVKLDLSSTNFSDAIRGKIHREFKYILRLLNFDKRCHNIFRIWYIDGKLAYNKVIDLDNPSLGILELRYIDAVRLKYIRKLRGRKKSNVPNIVDYGEFDEYFEYFQLESDVTQKKSGIKLSKDSVTYITSGLINNTNKVNLSYLHKAIKPINQLRMMEDSLVIYRLARGPERRIFYIDTGNLPPLKAEQRLKQFKDEFRNKLIYDSQTGEVRDDRRFTSMLEDYWFTRSEGGRSTQVETLPGGAHLDEIQDVEYFQKRLYRSLNVPVDRLDPSSSFGDDPGKTAISREEIKFTKFIGRLRKRFSELFHDILKTQLVLKGIITIEDWEESQENIQYDFIYDNHFNELKELEIKRGRLELLAQIQPYIGIVYSWKYAKKYILQLTDEEIAEMDIEIAQEIDDDLIVDPRLNVRTQSIPIDPNAPPDDTGASGSGGKSTAADNAAITQARKESEKVVDNINKSDTDRRFEAEFNTKRDKK